MKKILTNILCAILLFSCSSDKKTSNNSDLVFVELDDIEVKEIEGIEKAYYEGKPLTGMLVYPWRDKTAVKELRDVKDGILTGIVRSHRNEKIIGNITTTNGVTYKLAMLDEEITADKRIVYFDNSKQVEIESEGYLNRDLQGNFLGFIQEGKCTYYKKDGSVSRVTEYQNDREIE
ncbi:hypothetical protein N9772_07110 [Bacteroidia bacterium]|jgi:hypothetical protein|nr:hypothetical protein [Bacteroidia bacterium]